MILKNCAEFYILLISFLATPFQKLGLLSRNAGGRWYAIDAVLIKIPAVNAHIL